MAERVPVEADTAERDEQLAAIARKSWEALPGVHRDEPPGGWTDRWDYGAIDIRQAVDAAQARARAGAQQAADARRVLESGAVDHLAGELAALAQMGEAEVAATLERMRREWAAEVPPDVVAAIEAECGRRTLPPHTIRIPLHHRHEGAQQ